MPFLPLTDACSGLLFEVGGVGVKPRLHVRSSCPLALSYGSSSCPAKGIPAIVGCGDATDKLAKGDEVTVSCAEGDTGRIYDGLLKFEKTETDVGVLPEVPGGMKIMMNVGNPESAFTFGQLPSDGIGLARLEFVINNAIGVHPKALLNYDTIDADTKALIDAKMKGYSSPKEFYTQKIVEGVATLACSVYPKKTIVRLSDFKSNEYKSLIGGEQYEPDEENPMIGFRGCGRYADPFFEGCFAMELEAIRKCTARWASRTLILFVLSVVISFWRLRLFLSWVGRRLRRSFLSFLSDSRF